MKNDDFYSLKSPNVQFRQWVRVRHILSGISASFRTISVLKTVIHEIKVALKTPKPIEPDREVVADAHTMTIAACSLLLPISDEVRPVASEAILTPNLAYVLNFMLYLLLFQISFCQSYKFAMFLGEEIIRQPYSFIVFGTYYDS